MTSVRPVFATVFNFRDLGGHRVEDGRTVAYGRLFRSDSLHRITVDEGRQLAELGVRTVLDLRRPIYRKTAAYGHFGRPEPDFTWEQLPRVDDLRAALGL